MVDVDDRAEELKDVKKELRKVKAKVDKFEELVNAYNEDPAAAFANVKEKGLKKLGEDGYGEYIKGELKNLQTEKNNLQTEKNNLQEEKVELLKAQNKKAPAGILYNCMRHT